MISISKQLPNLLKTRAAIVGLVQNATLASSAQPQKKPKVEYTKLFINNRFVDAQSGKRFKTLNPATGEVITEVAEADVVSLFSMCCDSKRNMMMIFEFF